MDYTSKLRTINLIRCRLSQVESESRNLYYAVRCGCRAETELDDMLSLIPAIKQGLAIAETDIIKGEEMKYAHKK